MSPHGCSYRSKPQRSSMSTRPNVYDLQLNKKTRVACSFGRHNSCRADSKIESRQQMLHNVGQCMLVRNITKLQSRQQAKNADRSVSDSSRTTLWARVHAVPENNARIVTVRTRVATTFVVQCSLNSNCRKVVECTLTQSHNLGVENCC